MPLKFPKLNENAIPCKFKNLPHYLSTKRPTERRDPDSRREQIRVQSEQKLKEVQQEDIINDYNDILNYFTCKLNLLQWHYKVCDECVWFYNLNIDLIEKNNTEVNVICSIAIFSDLTVKVFLKDNEIPKQDLKEIFPAGPKVRRWSDLISLLSKYLNLSIHYTEKATLEHFLEKASSALDKAIEIAEHQEYENKTTLKIVTDEVKLMRGKRQYSPVTLIFSFMLLSFSHSCYNLVKDYLILPHKRYLQQISSTLNVSCNSTHYLKEMSKSLPQNNKYVFLLIDEIYVNSCLSFKSQNILGFAENNTNELARTVQTFMITSCFGNFKEIVKLLPVKKMTGDQLKKITLEVITFVQQIGFIVVAIVTDNNRVNQSMFNLLSHTGIMPNPNILSQPIYLTYDFVHIFKNIRNNWLNLKGNVKTFVYPDFETNDVVRTASFEHLRTFHKNEIGNVIKKAYKLSNKALYPTTFERQNVNLVDNIFHESTIAALKTVPEYLDTAIFLSIIKRWWDIVNTKCTVKGLVKRNSWATPIFHVNDQKIHFLRNFVVWVGKWKALKYNAGLSKDTFEALERCTKTLLMFADYALTKLNIEFVLPGKLQTDPLEKRFGKYRIMSGCNYNVSFRQILESEKKIRVKHLIEVMEKKCLNIKDMKCDWKGDTDTCAAMQEFDLIFSSNYLESYEISNSSEMLYVCGYVSHSLSKKLTCDMCIALVTEIKGSEVNDTYFDHLQRGGLSVPTDIIMCVYFHISCIFQHIIDTPQLLEMFLKLENQRNLLINLTLKSLQVNSVFNSIDEECACGQQFIKILSNAAMTLTNIILNNYTKCVNNMSQENNKKRKLQPLGY